MESSRFTLFIALSLALHAAGAAWYLHTAPVAEKPIASKTNSLMISAGIQAALAGAAVIAPPPPTTEPEAKLPTTAMVQPKNVVPTAKPIVKKQLVKKPAERATPKKTLSKKPVTTKTVAKKPAKPHSNQTPTRPIATNKPNKQIGTQGVNGVSNTTAKTKATGAKQQAGGASEAQFNHLVRQHFLSKKVTPKAPRKRYKQASVTIEFEIDRQGRLLSHRLVKSAKVREFDRAAILQVKKAQPYPKAPSDISWQSQKYTIDINYNIR